MAELGLHKGRRVSALSKKLVKEPSTKASCSPASTSESAEQREEQRELGAWGRKVLCIAGGPCAITPHTPAGIVQDSRFPPHFLQP